MQHEGSDQERTSCISAMVLTADSFYGGIDTEKKLMAMVPRQVSLVELGTIS